MKIVKLITAFVLFGLYTGNAFSCWKDAYEYYVSPLYTAAENGDMHRVKELLANGVSVNDRNNTLGDDWYPDHDHDGVTPLFAAIYSKNSAIIDLLIQEGANLDAGTGYASPLRAAAKQGSWDIFELLVKHGASRDFDRALNDNLLTISAAQLQRLFHWREQLMAKGVLPSNHLWLLHLSIKLEAARRDNKGFDQALYTVIGEEWKKPAQRAHKDEMIKFLRDHNALTKDNEHLLFDWLK